MFWSIDSCQDRVPANQYHLNVSLAQVSTRLKLLQLLIEAFLVPVLRVGCMVWISMPYKVYIAKLTNS